MKHAAMSNAKDPENRSKKDCICGCHNAHDKTKNLHHHGTRQKHLIRKSRQLKLFQGTQVRHGA